MLSNTKLDLSQKLIILDILSYQNSELKYYKTIEDIALTLGISASTVKRSISKLNKYEWFKSFANSQFTIKGGHFNSSVRYIYEDIFIDFLNSHLDNNKQPVIEQLHVKEVLQPSNETKQPAIIKENNPIEEMEPANKKEETELILTEKQMTNDEAIISKFVDITPQPQWLNHLYNYGGQIIEITVCRIDDNKYLTKASYTKYLKDEEDRLFKLKYQSDEKEEEQITDEPNEEENINDEKEIDDLEAILNANKNTNNDDELIF